ncbi:hypothetical protein EV667_0527 [Ancylobacter aquaticus]|uniref:Uncharacterized protein n=1 Tax=Ancylobacter aquaticus TaxID=100 RepID=A0A4R1I543_ANCAQ|nr:hypothetical protein [Ancylobacter aquaticus]TCK30437.1 hypothetical protein EV667_0527 [Ancylobacter aquaticus]
MSNVVPFPVRVPAPESEGDLDIDILTAVDVAIRDLRDIAFRLRGDASGQEQAHECLDMLTRALENARAQG